MRNAHNIPTTDARTWPADAGRGLRVVNPESPKKWHR
jgi:hypothetical protein